MISTKNNLQSVFAFFTIVCSALVSFHTAEAQSVSEQTILLTVGKETHTLGSLQKAFRKNINRQDAMFSKLSKDSLVDFINLYANYRLKVLDAISRGIDKEPGVKSELENNRKLLAETYYLEKKLVEPNIKEIQTNRKKDIKIAVVFVSFAKSYSESGSLQRANSILNLLKSGANFARVAKDSSDDEQTGTNGGELPYITGGMLLREIEQAAFSLKVGQLYPTPVKTKVGYFIITLLKDEPRYFIYPKHILLSNNPNDSMSVIRKADSLLAVLRKNPTRFEAMAKEFSDDKQSSEKGGYLGNGYSRSTGMKDSKVKLVAEVEDALFSLKPGNNIEKVVSEYGVHILKVDSISQVKPELEKEEVKEYYKRIYFTKDKEDLIESERVRLGYKWNEETLSELLSVIDTSKTTMQYEWAESIPATLKNKVIYSAPYEPFTVQSFADSLTKRSDFRGYSLNRNGFIRAMDKMISVQIIRDAAKNLEKEYPDFAEMMQEFRDGILLFKIEDQEVWSKLQFDSIKARTFFDTSKTKYMTKESYNISEIYVMADSSATTLKRLVDNGEDFGSMAEKFTQRDKFREKKGNWGVVAVQNNSLAAFAKERGITTAGTIFGPVKFEGGYSIIKVNEYLPVRPKSFEEAIADFAPAYQDAVQKQLTSQWLESVRKRFPIVINMKAIDALRKGK
jgi:peptidyl-prolyl cis-trans isomerase SurA